MNKADLIAKVALKSGQTKKAVDETVEALVDVVTTSLKSGEEVKLSGLGTFKVAHRAARVGVNPQTKQKMQIAASKAAVFKVSATLKKAVSGK
ncbi:MAG: HU family DNA-binding protein [Clostridiales bacterium]|jgi:DNA-binding protein HU-beta|nr:HU family DNA-binding protein [Clostridiales bacterium]